MNVAKLSDLAAAAGLSTAWTDFSGDRHEVAPETLRAVLAAIGLPAESPADLVDSLARASHTTAAGAMLTADTGGSIAIPGKPGRARLRLEDGDRLDIALIECAEGWVEAKMPGCPGYHTLEFAGEQRSVAVAPERGWTVDSKSPARDLWGLAVQLYSLRGGSTAGFGDFSALAAFAQSAAKAGAAAVAVSPVHAQFAADPGRYSPYSPSSRMFLNPLHAALDHPDTDIDPADDLIDWPREAAQKFARLREAYRRFRQGDQNLPDAFVQFVASGGPRLLSHARFQALDARFRPRGITHWRNWPDGFADASSTATGALAADHPEVEFHLFAQFLAERSLAAAHRTALSCGMSIGLISDIAVGMDGAGSDAWSCPGEVLSGVSIGAPPDLLGPDGQNWGLTSFSPTGLARTGFEGFLLTLRAGMRNAGGVRIDHAMGLQRLWVVPEGASAAEGTYLTYPRTDLLRLLALESLRSRAILVGEDLGTVPADFRAASTGAGMMGMRVLWFERDEAGEFRRPEDWDRDALALTTTHDLPTIAGWWAGNDIEWRARTSGNEERAMVERAGRTADRACLWRALLDADCATGEPPAPDDPGQVVDGGIQMIAQTNCELAIFPAEDALGLDQQPNLPGTIDSHPNWRRRLPEGDLFADDNVRRRLDIINRARTSA